MRIENLRGQRMFSTFFTAWGYQVSYLEFIASIASFIGVGLGITGKRITWPWWALSSALYGVFFYEQKYLASAALQIIFIVAAIAGWFGWEASGAKPGPLKNSYRISIVIVILLATFAFAPLLMKIGALAALPDTLLFFGSFAAQLLMVFEKYDNWTLWFVVDAGYVVLYASQGLLLTTLLYFSFTLMAAIGWRSWYGSHQRALRQL